MPIGMPLPCVLLLFNVKRKEMFSKVKTKEDAALLVIGTFVFVVGFFAFLAIGAVVVKLASML